VTPTAGLSLQNGLRYVKHAQAGWMEDGEHHRGLANLHAPASPATWLAACQLLLYVVDLGVRYS